MKRYYCLLFLIFLSLSTIKAQQITFAPQWTAQSQFAGYYAALENGYYAEAGLDVTIKHPTKSYNSMAMLQEGSADIISSELIQAIMTINGGTDIVHLMQTTQHSTLVLLSQNDDVDELADLAGKRIGTWKIGFSEIPHMLDKKHNLGIEWIKFISSLNLYISGAIDATLAKTYNELIIFSMAGVIPNSILYFSDYGFDIPEDGLYASEEFFREHPDLCRKFTEASRRGWDWVRNNRESALEIVMEYARKDNVATNKYIQKWMLDEILKVQEDTEGGKPSYHLQKDDFDYLVGLLLEYSYISEPIEYDRFMGGVL